MIFDFNERLSDSPLVEVIYRTRSVGGGSFTSIATTQWEMVITKQKERITLSLRGPETMICHHESDSFQVCNQMRITRNEIPFLARDIIKDQTCRGFVDILSF